MSSRLEKVARIKVVVVGDPACGKSSMLMVFCHNGFPTRHIPTVFDTFAKSMCIEGRQVDVSFWDTAGQEDYDRLRPLSYTDSDVVIIAFAVDDPLSLANVTDKWSPEVRHYAPNKPVILTATKTDLRNENSLEHRTVLQTVHGEAGAFRIKADAYMECSAKANQGVRECFELAIKKALSKLEERAISSRSTCGIL